MSFMTRIDCNTYEERMSVSGSSAILCVGHTLPCPFNGNVCYIFRSPHNLDKHYVRIQDADDGMVEKLFDTSEEVGRFMASLPTFIDTQWLKSEGFEYW